MHVAPLGLGNRELDALSKGPNEQGRHELDAPSKIRNKSWTLVITVGTRNRSWTLVSKASPRITIDTTLRIPRRTVSRGALQMRLARGGQEAVPRLRARAAEG